MWHKVYYENYVYGDDSYLSEKKKLPYMVRETNKDKREAFKDYLTELGYECCSWNGSYPGILVNPDLKRFAMIPKPCSFSHIGKDYSIIQFKTSVLKGIKH